MKNISKKKYSIMSFVIKYNFIIMALIVFFAPLFFAGAITTDSKIANPLTGGIDTIPQFIEAVINIVLIVGVPILVLAVIYAGFLYVKAQGNPGELEVAHRTLLYTGIGGALLLGAFVIANAINSTVKEIGGNV